MIQLKSCVRITKTAKNSLQTWAVTLLQLLQFSCNGWAITWTNIDWHQIMCSLAITWERFHMNISCCAKFSWWIVKLYLPCILYHFSTRRWSMWLKSFLVEDQDILIVHRPCHSCWWPGDTRSRGSFSHGISISLPRYSSSNTRGVSATLPIVITVTS